MKSTGLKKTGYKFICGTGVYRVCRVIWTDGSNYVIKDSGSLIDVSCKREFWVLSEQAW